MKSNGTRRVRLIQIFFGMAVVVALFLVRGTIAGALPLTVRVTTTANTPVHLTTDWSHHHLMFSAPKSLAQQIRLSSNPRYVQQLLRRGSASNSQLNPASPDAWRWSRDIGHSTPLHGDWNAYLGVDETTGNAGTAGANVYPAKFSFSATTESCTNDYVVYPTGLAGSANPVAARTMGFFFNGDPVAGSTISVTNSVTTQTLTVTASATLNTGSNWLIVPGNYSSDATNLAAAINRAGNSATVGVTATANSPAAGQFTILSTNNSGVGTDGANGDSNLSYTNSDGGVHIQFPPTGAFVDGTAQQAGIVAYNKLYTPANGATANDCNLLFNGPTQSWAYNTGNATPIVTSPTISGDGTQVAFVQNNGTTSQLVILRPAPGGSNTEFVTAPTTEAAGACTQFVAPCMVLLTFSGGNVTDTNSSPFYDFAHDTMYVGDDNGFLHKFTGVFNGTPAEAAGNWPVNVTGGTDGASKLTSPVFDDDTGVNANGQVLVADFAGSLYRIDGGTAAVTHTTNVGVAFVDSPLLDVTNDTVYVFGVSTGAGCQSSVLNFSANFATGAGSPGRKNLGTTGDCPTTLYSGSFDEAFLAGGAGNMYVCAGGNGGTPGTVVPTLYQIALDAFGNPGTVTTGPGLTSALTTGCSAPITEFYDTAGTRDWFYVSVPGNGLSGDGIINCPTGNAGCIMSFNLVGGVLAPTTATTATAAASGGTSAIVIDNDVSTGGSQIYYTPLSTTAVQCTSVGNIGVGGCAIQASQALLQ